MKMNKKALKIGGGILVVGVIFSTGFFGQQIYTKATTDWQTNAQNNSSAKLGQAAQDKTNTMAQNVNSDIDAAVNDKLSTDIAQQQADLQNLLQQYYDAKINGLTNSQSFKDLESQIETLKYQILGQYKTQIDTMFAGK